MPFGCLLDAFWVSFGCILGCLLDTFWMPFGCVFWVILGYLWDVFGVSFGCLLGAFSMSVEFIDGHKKYQDLCSKTGCG